MSSLNSSGNGNPSRAQEHCVICHRVFNNIEALFNHYDTHTRGDELINLMNNNNNNNMIFQNQAPRRSLGFALGPSRNLLPPSFTAPEVPPIAVRNNTRTVMQQRQIQRPVAPAGPVRRRLNLGTRYNNIGNMQIRPARVRARAQRNQRAAPVPEIIDLEFGDEGISTTDGGINLDLTLGR